MPLYKKLSDLTGFEVNDRDDVFWMILLACTCLIGIVISTVIVIERSGSLLHYGRCFN